MKFFKDQKPSEDPSDAELVAGSLDGNRQAFTRIVERYQSLLCSVAYSLVGDLKHSEDIAQETFIDAWKKLDTLREPEKLKAWLCGIVRFKCSHFHRKEARQPIKRAETIEDASAELEQSNRSQASLEKSIIQEQEALALWQTLEKLPENYRIPLVLFYREQCSVALVAKQLELSEATAKQRLSRGRKLLQGAMVALVEETLEKSKPGAGFTALVLASISHISPPAKASTLGLGVLKAGSVFKWSGLFVVLTSFSGVISSFFSIRAALDQSLTARERRRTITSVALFFLFAIVFVAGMYLLRNLALNVAGYKLHFFIVSQLLVLAFCLSYLILTKKYILRQGEFRARERALHPEAFQNYGPAAKQREYRSRISLFGIPLIHFKLGMAEQGDKPAFAWIAGGDRAYGLLFAWGGIAVAPLSVGVLSIGLLSCGVVSLGLAAIGTVCFGVIGFGASAIAYKAYSSLSSLAWYSSISGGFAMAREAAIGSIAFAKQVNNDVAANLANLNTLNASYLWVLAILAVIVIAPAVWHANKVRQSMGKKASCSAN